MSVLGERREGAEEGGVISPRYAKDLENYEWLLGVLIKERLRKVYDEHDVDVKVKFEPLFSELVREDPNDVNVSIDINIGKPFYIEGIAESYAEAFDPEEYCAMENIPEDRCEEEVKKAIMQAVEDDVEEINSEYAEFIEGEISMEGWGRKLKFKVEPLVCSARDAEYYTACYAGLGVRITLEDARLDALKQDANKLAGNIANLIEALHNLYRGLW